jgi:chemotaxis protein CheD
VSQTGLMRGLTDLPQVPAGLPQFAHVRRTWDMQLDLSVARLLPGEYYVTRHDELIFTVLGSCVSACVRERKLGIGGMNHFMLPLDRSSGANAWKDDRAGSATRYGKVAMDRLINDILELGGERENLEFKLVGGAKILDLAFDVGAHNVQFVRDYLKTEDFAISAEDLGDGFARKVYYSPLSGKLRVKRLIATVNRTVFEHERHYTPASVPLRAGAAQLPLPEKI